MGKKLFDYVIGNPPYQEEQDSDDVSGSKKNYAPLFIMLSWMQPMLSQNEQN